MDRTLVVIAGPNGTGKSTFTRGHDFGVRVFDPDAIARTLPRGSARIQKAGREYLQQTIALRERGESFGIETTLSGLAVPMLMQKMRLDGARIVLHFVCTAGQDVEQSILLSKLRIKSRVELGGHGIPEIDVVRRFPRSIHNLHRVSSYVGEGYVYNNAGLEFERLAEKVAGSWIVFDNRFAWLTSGLQPQA